MFKTTSRSSQGGTDGLMGRSVEVEGGGLWQPPGKIIQEYNLRFRCRANCERVFVIFKSCLYELDEEKGNCCGLRIELRINGVKNWPSE